MIKNNALTQSRTEDRYITSVAPYQLGHKSTCCAKNPLVSSVFMFTRDFGQK